MPRKQDLKSLTVKDLKDKLACKKLPQSGKKEKLVKRLELHALTRKTLADRAKGAGLPVTGSKAMLVRRLESKKPLRGEIILKKPKSVPAKQRSKTRCVTPKRKSPATRKAAAKRKAPVKRKAAAKPRYAKRRAKTPPPSRKATKKPRRRATSTKRSVAERSVAERSLDEQLSELEKTMGLPPAQDVPAMVEELHGKTLASRLQGKVGIETRRQLERLDASEIDPKVSLALSRTNKDVFHSLLDLGEAEDASGMVLRDVVAAYYDRILDLWIPFEVLGKSKQFSEGQNISDLYKEYDVVTRETGVYLLLVLSGQIGNLLRLVEDLQEPGQRGKAAERLREKMNDVAIEVPLPRLAEIEYPEFIRTRYYLYKAKPDYESELLIPIMLLGDHPYLAEDTFGPEEDLAQVYNKYGVIPEFSGDYLVLVLPNWDDRVQEAARDIHSGDSKRKQAGMKALENMTNYEGVVIPLPYVPRGRQIYKKR